MCRDYATRYVEQHTGTSRGCVFGRSERPGPDDDNHIGSDCPSPFWSSWRRLRLARANPVLLVIHYNTAFGLRAELEYEDPPVRAILVTLKLLAAGRPGRERCAGMFPPPCRDLDHDAVDDAASTAGWRFTDDEVLVIATENRESSAGLPPRCPRIQAELRHQSRLRNWRVSRSRDSRG